MGSNTKRISGPNIITGETMGIMTKDELELFKESHGKDVIIEVGEQDVTTMNKNQLDFFAKDNSHLKNIGTLKSNQKIETFEKNQALLIALLNHLLTKGYIKGVTHDQLRKLKEFEETSVVALRILLSCENLPR